MKLVPMPFARESMVTLFAATFWLPFRETNAQESQPPRAPSPPTIVASGNAPKAGGESRSKIELTNSSIEELARLLEGEFERASFVVPQTVANIRVTLKLRNVNLNQILQAVAFATEQRVAAEEITENVYGFRLVPRTLPNGQPEPQTAVRVLSLAGAPQLAGGASAEASAESFKKVVDELATAFNDAVVMLREADPGSTVEQPRLKFHPSTKLLVAVGKPEELNIVEQLVAALGGGFATYNPPMAPGGYGSSQPSAYPGAAPGALPTPPVPPRAMPGGLPTQPGLKRSR